MRDPKQLFPMMSLCRATIACDLNDYFTDYEVKTTEHFDDGDDRLTDEVCRQYAIDYGEIVGEEFDEEEIQNACDDLVKRTLISLGCQIPE